MAKENGFVRWVQLRYDKAAGKRMQEEAELAMEAAGKGGAKELTEALAEGGKKGARALTTALNKEYRARMAAARKSFAEGLIDEAAYKRAGEEAALAYNKGLSHGIKQLKGSKLGLSELQGTQLAGRFKLPSRGAKSAGGMTGSLGGLMAGAAGPLVGLFAADKLKDVALEMRDLGTAAEEAGNKFQTTFGGAAPQVQRFLDSWAEMAGLDETAAHDLSATAGAVAEGMGLTQSASAGMSEQVMKLAGDLASFNNVPIEQAFQSVIGGITGERDSLKLFGIVVQQSEVDQRALANSHKTSTDALTAQEKAVASMQLMMEKAGVQVGDLERTQDSNANTTKRLTAEFKNAKIEIAKELLPVYSDMLGFVDDNSAALGTLAKFVGGVLIVAVRAASKVLVFLADVVLGGLDGAIGGVVLALSALVKGAGEAMGAVARLSELTGIGDSKAWRERADAIDQTAEALKKFGLQAAENGNRALHNAFSSHDRDTGGAPATPAAPAPVVVHTPRSSRKTTGSTSAGASSEEAAAFAPSVVGGEDGAPEVPLVLTADVVVPETATSRAQDFFSSVEGMAANAGGIMADHFSDAFGLLFSDIDNAGEAFKQLWAGVGAGIIGAVAAEAKSRAGLNSVKAMESLAMAAWEALHGNFPAASGYLAEAGKFTGIAAAYGALAGGAGAVLGGGGGVGGVPPAVHNPRLGSTADARQQGPEIHIYVDGIDPSNPSHQRLVYATGQQAQERFNGARVSIHPARGRAA